MRIISGKYRGKRLNSPKNEKIRPTTDMVKENVFNMIQSIVPDCRALDLFAGSGAISAELLSRGAAMVYSADCDSDSLAVAKSNLTVFDKESYKLIHADYRKALTSLQGLRFDIIYLDPPYTMQVLDEILELVLKYGLLSKNGVVVYESLTETNQKSTLKGFELYKTRKYGSVTVDIYRLTDDVD